jgi:hypothetical protein
MCLRDCFQTWRARCPELLESGRARFQGRQILIILDGVLIMFFLVHDFFKPQPIHPVQHSIFILRVVCHDWPDAFARRILLQLRRAAREFSEGDENYADGVAGTYLFIGDHVLPYAFAEKKEADGAESHSDRASSMMDESATAGIEGIEELSTLKGARWPLLSNLGAASANAYWMDLTVSI